MVDLLQDTWEEVGRLVPKLAQAVKEQSSGLAHRVIRQLGVFLPDLEKNKETFKKSESAEVETERHKKPRKPRKISSRGLFFSKEQTGIISERIGLDGKPWTFQEIYRKRYPNHQGTVDAKDKNYSQLNSWFRSGATKLLEIEEAGIEMNALPEDTRQFLKRIKEKYPGKGIGEILRTTTGYGRGRGNGFKKRNAEEMEVATGERKPFRAPDGNGNGSVSPNGGDPDSGEWDREHDTSSHAGAQKDNSNI